MKLCFHCLGYKVCACLTCAPDEKKVGPCAACSIPREPIPDWLDLRDANNWECVKPEAPTHPYRRLKIAKKREAAA